MNNKNDQKTDTNGTDAIDKEVVPVPYSPEEQAYRGQIIRMLENCRDERDMSHPEFDNLSYLLYYDTNKKADLSYIGPRINKDDYRVVTGTTREKTTTILSTLLELNLEPDFFAFDEDSMLDWNVSKSFEDMVKDSRIQEDYASIRGIIYRELISQGDVFVEELWCEEFQPQVDIVGEWDPSQEIDAFQVNEQLKKAYAGPRVRFVPGKKVFLGDVKCQLFKNQPLAFTYEVLTRRKAETIYSGWSRWKYVPKGTDTTVMPEFGDGPTYKDFNWNLYKVNKDQVGVLKLYIPGKNRMMLMLNGVMMLPVKYPLTAVSPSGKIPIAQGRFEPIPDFAYSKGVSAKTKVEQTLLDELLKLYVLKTRQSARPTLGNKSRKVFSQDVTIPGKIINDVGPNDLFPLFPNQQLGVTGPEFNFYAMVKADIEEKSVNSAYQGNTQKGTQTATEIMTQKQQQMLKLSAGIDGVMNLERDMSYLRLWNILGNYGKPMKDRVSADGSKMENVYRTVSTDGQIENGEVGLKIYRFAEEFPKIAEQLKEEDKLSEKLNNKKVRILYVSPNICELIRRRWYCEINSNPKKTDQLSQLIFMDTISKAIEFFGPQSINAEKLKKKFAQKFGMTYDDIFLDPSMQPEQNMIAGGGNPENPSNGFNTKTLIKDPLKKMAGA